MVLRPQNDSASTYRDVVTSGRLLLLAVVLAALVVPGSASAAGQPATSTWHSVQINQSPALKAGYNGHGVTVAVLDGWIDTSHGDFGGRAVAAADCTSGTCSTTMGRDACGQQHGTHVAGSVASSSYGVAPGARLLAVRVLKDDGSGDCTGTPSGVAAGIEWSVRHGAQVLNLSLGPDVPGQTSHGVIADAVASAADAGVVVVFSAGNSELPVAQAYGSDALVVAATGPSGRLASYSQHGQGVSVAAPGGEPNGTTCSQVVCITSLYPGNQYAVAAGTSMAAPQVAGLAALLFQQQPNRGRADVVRRITGTARPLTGAGAGLVDVAAALGVRTTTAASTPAPRRTTAAPRPKPTVKPSAVRAATSPSPIAVLRTPTATPSRTATPLRSQAPVPALAGAGQEIPTAVAGIAGALVGLAGAGVFLAGLTRRR